MYGEAVITVPPLSISDDEDEHEGKEALDTPAAAGRASQDNNARPVPSLELSRMYSMFYRESPGPQSGVPQSNPEPAQQIGPAPAVNTLLSCRSLPCSSVPFGFPHAECCIG